MTQRELAKQTGLGLGTINADIQAGAPHDTAEELLAWRRAHRHKSSPRRASRPVANRRANAEASSPIDSGVEMIALVKAERIFREFTAPLKRELERLPVLARSRCNPSDPGLAQGVLKSEIRMILKRISTFEETLEK